MDDISDLMARRSRKSQIANCKSQVHRPVSQIRAFRLCRRPGRKAIGRREPTGCTGNTSPTRKRVHAFSAWRWNALACASGLYWYVFICRSPKSKHAARTVARATIKRTSLLEHCRTIAETYGRARTTLQRCSKCLRELSFSAPHFSPAPARMVSGLTENAGRKMRTSIPLLRRIDGVAESAQSLLG